jgi:probable rRNA maturation factor
MIEVNNLTRSKVDEVALCRVAETVLKGEKKAEKNVSIAIVGLKRSEELNKQHRKKDKVANVLSFAGEGSELGEVILCPQQIKKDAKEYGMIYERALLWMLIHGLLHLAGYDHEGEKEAKKMEQKEQYYLSLLK